jgi:cytosine/adenosine deaminase-related metal-dependent hydrolase
VRHLADRYRVPIHTHAFGGMIRQVARHYPELLGPDLSIAHCTGLDDEEVRILGEARASVAHGPLTHAFVAAWCPVMELLEAGANVVIATDASAPDRSYDLLAQVHPAMQLQRVHYRDSSVLPAGKALAMVTIDAARALGLADEIGSLAVGKKADVILLDARQPHWSPFAADLAPHRLAYMATGQDVEIAIVDGRVLLEDRRVLTVDVPAVLAGAEREARAALERAGATDALALPPTFWTGTRYGAVNSRPGMPYAPLAGL